MQTSAVIFPALSLEVMGQFYSARRCFRVASGLAPGAEQTAHVHLRDASAEGWNRPSPGSALPASDPRQSAAFDCQESRVAGGRRGERSPPDPGGRLRHLTGWRSTGAQSDEVKAAVSEANDGCGRMAHRQVVGCDSTLSATSSARRVHHPLASVMSARILPTPLTRGCSSGSAGMNCGSDALRLGKSRPRIVSRASRSSLIRELPLLGPCHHALGSPAQVLADLDGWWPVARRPPPVDRALRDARSSIRQRASVSTVGPGSACCVAGHVPLSGGVLDTVRVSGSDHAVMSSGLATSSSDRLATWAMDRSER